MMMLSCNHDYRYFIVPGWGFTPMILHPLLRKPVTAEAKWLQTHFCTVQCFYCFSFLW